jgi:hypothetical protein
MRGRLRGDGAVFTLAAVLAGAVQTFGSPRRAAAVAVMTLALAAGAAGCGSDSSDDVTIPQQNADDMLAALDAVQTACQAEDTTGARTAANDFVQQVNALPEEVGSEAKNALRDAGKNLETLATSSSDCTGGVPEITTDSSTDETTTTSSSTTTEETTTTSTETSTEEDTDTTTTEPPPEEPPPDEGNGGGNQGGGSGGVGGGG